MTFLGIKIALFGTASRRLASALLINAVFYGAAFGIQHYVDNVTGSPGLSFVLVAVWMALGVIAALITVTALGDRLIGSHFTNRLLVDELADLDRRLDLAEQGLDPDALVDAQDDDLLALASGNSGVRFAMYFLLLAAVNIMSSNRIGDQFLQRYTHPGLAVIHMRSDDAKLRRTGLTMLTERLEIVATPAVAKVALRALADPNEGVKARAAFVIGVLGVDTAAEALAELAKTNEALTFVALISLGQIRKDAARAAIAKIVDEPLVIKEPRALASALGLLRVPAIERLRLILSTSTDQETRATALWALGQLREPRLSEVAIKALEDADLGVRCAAVEALELMAIYEASKPLRAAFEAIKDPLEACPEITVPVQEGGTALLVVKPRNYQLSVVRALHTTDDPALLKWYVDHQEGLESKTNALMRKSWEALSKKNKDGKLNHLKKRIQLETLQQAPVSAPPQVPQSAAPGSAAAAPGSAAAPASAPASTPSQ
ncbi:MAG: HEAT repeat protein [Bradymonadia bacterium]